MSTDRQPLAFEQYAIRKKELNVKISLSLVRLKEQRALLKAHNLASERLKAVDGLESAVRYSERVLNDSIWIVALQEARVPLRTVLKVWDIRERIMQELSTPTNDD